MNGTTRSPIEETFFLSQLIGARAYVKSRKIGKVGDIVAVDHHMPVYDGLEVIRILGRSRGSGLSARGRSRWTSTSSKPMYERSRRKRSS